MRIAWTIDAVHDLQAAWEWYSERSQQAASGLLLAIERLQDLLKLFPEAYPIKSAALRTAAVGQHPYVLVYSVEEDEVLVHGLIHTKRDRPR